MRRVLFVTLGILEMIVGGVLFYAVTLIPSEVEVREPVSRIENIARTAEDQLGQLRTRVAELREKRPVIRAAARELRDNTREFADAILARPLDFSTLQSVSNALTDVADGLDAVKEHLRAENGKQLKVGLKAVADFLDNKVAKSANEAATRLERGAEAMKNDAETFGKLLRLALPEPKAAQITEGLPSIAIELAALLRETARVKEIVDLLRQSEEGLTPLVASWPKVQASLTKAVEVLRKTQEQLGRAIGNKEGYENALAISTRVARTYTAALPALADQLEVDLTQQEETLDELAGNVSKTRTSLPAFVEGLVRILYVANWLVRLTAVIVVLHGLSFLVWAFGEEK